MKKQKRYGFWSTFLSLNVIDISINAGFDFVISDMEHGTHDLNSIASSTYYSKDQVEMFTKELHKEVFP